MTAVGQQEDQGFLLWCDRQKSLLSAKQMQHNIKVWPF